MRKADVHVRTLDLDLDVAKPAVVLLVGGCIAQEIVVAEVALDAIEALAEIVGVVEGQPAGAARQLAQRVRGIAAKVVLVVFEPFGVRTAPTVGCIAGVEPKRARLVDGVADLGLVALGPQAHCVHRVDGDVGTVRRVGDTEKEAVHGRRNGDARREEHEAFPARNPGECVDDREEPIGRGVALLVPLHGLEVAERRRLHPSELRGGR